MTAQPRRRVEAVEIQAQTVARLGLAIEAGEMSIGWSAWATPSPSNRPPHLPDFQESIDLTLSTLRSGALMRYRHTALWALREG